MRIAHLAPPWLPIPPANYGGTENVIYHLIEEQVAQGHRVTLFAPGDAKTSARQIAFFADSLLHSGYPWHSHPMAFYHTYKSIDYVKKHAHQFDILHSHLSSSSDLYMFPLTADLPLPHVATLHSQFPFDRVGTEWTGEADRSYMEWISEVPLVAISRSAQRQEEAKFPLHFIDVVHHGVDIKSFSAPQTPDDFFVWIGRVVPEKGLHLAIEAAKKAQVPLVIAGFIDPQLSQACRYFAEQIEPEIDGQQIRFVGPVSPEQRNALLSRARGMLNPLLWEEPFGMVMLEALAAGCPVITFRRGAAEELIIPGVTGYLVENIAEMIEKIPLVDALDRKKVQAYAADHFSSYQMAKNYTRVYEKVIEMDKQVIEMHEKVIEIREKEKFVRLPKDRPTSSEILVS